MNASAALLIISCFLLLLFSGCLEKSWEEKQAEEDAMAMGIPKYCSSRYTCFFHPDTGECYNENHSGGSRRNELGEHKCVCVWGDEPGSSRCRKMLASESPGIQIV